jgi:hypothetical protein
MTDTIDDVAAEAAGQEAGGPAFDEQSVAEQSGAKPAALLPLGARSGRYLTTAVCYRPGPEGPFGRR